MTCKDCKYYKPINDNEGKCNSPMDAYYGFDTTVVGGLGKCEYFVSKDGTYYDGTYHCPRCGKAVDKWGLCSECKKVYEVFDEYGNYKFPTDVVLDKPNDATSCPIDNSWESVSKWQNY